MEMGSRFLLASPCAENSLSNIIVKAEVAYIAEIGALAMIGDRTPLKKPLN